MKKLILLFLLPFISLAQSTTITAGSGGNVEMPNLTNSQIQAITSPRSGMMVFDKTFNVIKYYNGTAWIALYQQSCECCNQYCQGLTSISSAEASGNISTYAETNAIDVDANGNVYIIGSFNASITFNNNIFLTKISFQSYLVKNMFIAKFDQNGLCQWAKRIGPDVSSTGNMNINAIDIDNNGNVYLGGNVSGTVTDSTTTITAQSYPNPCLLKYDASGNIIFNKVFGNNSTANNERIIDLSLDNQGNIYTIGEYWNNFTTDGQSLSNAGGSDIFVGKFNSINGTCTWLRSAGGSGNDEAGGIFVHQANTNKMFFTGKIFGNATVGTSSVSVGTSNGDMFRAEFDASGANGVSGVYLLGISNTAKGLKIKALDASNGVLVGKFNGSFTAAGNTYSGATESIFIQKFNLNTGIISRINTIVGNAGLVPKIDLSVASTTEIILAGYYFGSSSFAGFTPNTNSQTSDAFILKLDANLSFSCIKLPIGAYEDEIHALTTDTQGNVYTLGRTLSSTLDFGNVQLSSQNFGYALFMAKLTK